MPSRSRARSEADRHSTPLSLMYRPPAPVRSSNPERLASTGLLDTYSEPCSSPSRFPKAAIEPRLALFWIQRLRPLPCLPSMPARCCSASTLAKVAVLRIISAPSSVHGLPLPQLVPSSTEATKSLSSPSFQM